ncbi:MAG TPA: HEAT repeat domain-containing protein [Nocardioides sp.]|uniref:HEAT repeat domain-containing protein n=1 Tax=Nocardioides sp. TaxID=35761 RepID=UPI002B6A51CE|nr:HEAT repeat domain-containing protein [Nocardioides sp.]HQR27495.1 HEAT repeat domain-containing protein [Nocardioides sp.]
MGLFGPPDVPELIRTPECAPQSRPGIPREVLTMGIFRRRPKAPKVAGEKAPVDVDGVVEMLRSENTSTRQDAVRALAELGDRRAAPALLEVTADETDALRVRAAYALATLGDPRATPVLLSALDHRPDMDTDWAVRGLGHLRCSDAVMPLARLLNELAIVSTIQVNLWLDVAEALKAIGDPRAVDALLDWRSNPSINTRAVYDLGVTEKLEAAVVDALAVCGREVVPTLVSSAMETHNSTAFLALEKLDWEPQSDKERLARALAREDWVAAGEVGAMAVEPLLLNLGCELVGERWMKRSGDFGNGDAHGHESEKIVAIADALGATGDSRTVEPLVQLLSAELNGLWGSGRASVRRSAAGALRRIGEPAVQPLAVLIGAPRYWGDESEQEAARALAMIGPAGLEVLGQNLRKHSEAHDRHVQLDRSEPGRSHYGDPDITGYRKWEAIRKALVVGAGTDALPILQTMLHDENESVRTDAEELLAEIAEPETA